MTWKIFRETKLQPVVCVSLWWSNYHFLSVSLSERFLYFQQSIHFLIHIYKFYRGYLKLFKMKTNLEHRSHTCYHKTRFNIWRRCSSSIITKHTICKRSHYMIIGDHQSIGFEIHYMILILQYLLSFKNRRLICWKPFRSCSEWTFDHISVFA